MPFSPTEKELKRLKKQELEYRLDIIFEELKKCLTEAVKEKLEVEPYLEKIKTVGDFILF